MGWLLTVGEPSTTGGFTVVSMAEKVLEEVPETYRRLPDGENAARVGWAGVGTVAVTVIVAVSMNVRLLEKELQVTSLDPSGLMAMPANMPKFCEWPAMSPVATLGLTAL